MKHSSEITALLCLWLTVAPNSNPEPGLSAVLEDKLVIGADETLPAEYLLGMPWHAAGIAGREVFVADRADLGVKVFAEDGTYLRTIGRRGRGPGEIRDITGMALDPSGSLIVADGSNRRLTRFSFEGKVIADRAMNSEEMMFPRRMRVLPGGDVIFLYKLPGLLEARGSVRPDSNFMFHVYDPQLSAKKAVFGRWDRIVGTGPDAELVSSFAPGNFDVSTSGAIVYAPLIANGALHLFERRQGNWELAKTLRGRQWSKPAYDRHDPDGPKLPGVEYFRGKETVALAIHRTSLGIFFLSDGRIVHFIQVDEGGHSEIGVEVYDSGGTYQGYDSVQADVVDGPVAAPSVQFSWKDGADNFYILELTREGGPTVRVARLVLS